MYNIKLLTEVITITSVMMNLTEVLPTPIEDSNSPDESSSSDKFATFMSGRNCGEQASYNGYTYSHGYDNVINGNRYWACKDKKKYKPACKGQLARDGSPPHLGDMFLRFYNIVKAVRHLMLEFKSFFLPFEQLAL